ncbi:hypothetical protein NL676_011005 [Syzygium grande]|nr:hypothetical protein NL676_011005 [Syzygium grande]
MAAPLELEAWPWRPLEFEAWPWQPLKLEAWPKWIFTFRELRRRELEAWPWPLRSSSKLGHGGPSSSKLGRSGSSLFGSFVIASLKLGHGCSARARSLAEVDLRLPGASSL